MLLPCSHSPPFYLNASGLTSIRPRQTLQLCLQILLGDGKKNPILQRGMVHFFPLFFHILFETRQEENTVRESERAKLSAKYTWPCFLNYLPSAAPFEEG